MKNITITLPEDVARWLRIRAAENERSVSKCNVFVYRHDSSDPSKQACAEFGVVSDFSAIAQR